jgi:hypothetical protein
LRHLCTGLPARAFLASVWTTQQVPRRYLVGFPYQKNIILFLSPWNVLLLLLLHLSRGRVGGLTLASALSKSPDIRVHVYEAASKFTEIDVGIGVWWRTKQVLKSLGLELEEDVIRSYLKSDQPNGRALGTMYTRGLVFSFSD